MANKIAKKVRTEAGVTINFEDKAKTALVMELSVLSAAIRKELELLGLSQKVGDAYSKAESVQDAIDKATVVWENLKAGVFNGRSGGSGSSILIEAIARMKKSTVEAVALKLAALSEEAVEKLAKRADVKATVEIIKGERAQAKLADGDFDELDLEESEETEEE